MKNKEQLLNKENWIQYLNLADDGGLTNNAKANDIVSKIQQAINFIPCCTELKAVNDGKNSEGMDLVRSFNKAFRSLYFILHCDQSSPTDRNIRYSGYVKIIPGNE